MKKSLPFLLFIASFLLVLDSKGQIYTVQLEQDSSKQAKEVVVKNRPNSTNSNLRTTGQKKRGLKLKQQVIHQTSGKKDSKSSLKRQPNTAPKND